MTTIQEAVDWITARHNFHHGFDHFQRFMASQGDPQDQLRTIHVAGTNGKGSTVSYLASVCAKPAIRSARSLRRI